MVLVVTGEIYKDLHQKGPPSCPILAFRCFFTSYPTLIWVKNL